MLAVVCSSLGAYSLLPSYAAVLFQHLRKPIQLFERAGNLLMMDSVDQLLHLGDFIL